MGEQRRPRLQTLKPRVSIARSLLGRLDPLIPIHVERLRGRALQQRNDRILARDPLCKCCLAQDRISASTQVDHIVPVHLNGSDDDSNLQGLCDPCHEAKTAQEQRDRLSGAAVIVGPSSPRDPVLA